MSPGCLTPGSELLITKYAHRHHPCSGTAGMGAARSALWSTVFCHCPPFILLLLGTSCLPVLPVRTRVDRLWTPAHAQAKQAHALWLGGCPGYPSPMEEEGGKNTCPFCLPTGARSRYQVGTWYVSNCRGMGARGG